MTRSARALGANISNLREGATAGVLTSLDRESAVAHELQASVAALEARIVPVC